MESRMSNKEKEAWLGLLLAHQKSNGCDLTGTPCRSLRCQCFSDAVRERDFLQWEAHARSRSHMQKQGRP